MNAKERFIELMTGPTEAGKSEAWRAVAKEMAEENDLLRERCEAYKGQVWAGSQEIERLRAVIRCEQESSKCVMIHDPERAPCTRRTCHFMGVVYPKLVAAYGQSTAKGQ